MKILPLIRIATFAATIFALFAFSLSSLAETVRLYFDSTTPQIAFAAGDIKAALEKQNHTVENHNLAALAKSGSGKKIVLAIATDKVVASTLSSQGGKPAATLGEQAYALRTTAKPDRSYWVLGGDATGAMYGGLQIAENISVKGLSGSYESEEAPFMMYRGMKLNMPLDRRIPTYVGGWSSASAKKAISHVWDLTFWKTLIDQQARNRYNLLSVWVHHPFPALVKLEDYPKACLPRIEGFDGFVKEMNHDQRVAFWREVMQHAHDRGMKFYFFNWNVYVDYARQQYPEITQDLGNAHTIKYMNQCIKALIETYPDLDGFGITAGDGMSKSSEENTKWTYDAIGKAVKEYLAANPSRKFTLIHRSVYSNPELFDEIYASRQVSPNLAMEFSFKYAQAHMYSTPTPRWGAAVESAAERGIKTWLTIRNDDYFYLTWGDPQFVRDFMAGIPIKTNVTTIYIGSDGYNPSRTYFFKDETRNGQLEVERRWYMEMLWARIAYNPATSDEVFKNLLAKRYPGVAAGDLFDAWTLASRSLPKVTELIMRDWSLDFHWYPEGCWSDPGRCSGFRSIDDIPGPKGGFAGQDVARGSSLCNIADSAAGKCGGKKSSYQLADEMEADAKKSLALISKMKSGGNAELELALNNVKQMGYLSSYYAHKIRGATYKKAGEKTRARDEMAEAYCWWTAYSRSMEATYKPDAFRNLAIAPDWKYADAAVLKEYTDLGGTGIPDCSKTQPD